MSIEAMKLAIEALENASPAAWASRVDSDTMKSIWRKHAEALEGLQVLLAELDNASCKSAQKRLEAQQPASKEHIFELWWEAHMPNTTQEQAWTAFTAAVASNGVGIAAQQPATPEPVGYLYDFKHDDEIARDWFTQNIDEIQFRPATCLNIRPLYAHPAPGVQDDSKRLDYLQDRGATIDLIPGVADFYPMQFRVGGLHASANTDVRAAIDAAMLAANEGSK